MYVCSRKTNHLVPDDGVVTLSSLTVYSLSLWNLGNSLGNVQWACLCTRGAGGSLFHITDSTTNATAS